jgi:hypothetical protein
MLELLTINLVFNKETELILHLQNHNLDQAEGLIDVLSAIRYPIAMSTYTTIFRTWADEYRGKGTQIIRYHIILEIVLYQWVCCSALS